MVAILNQYFCFHRRFLVFNLVGRNLKMRYRRSLLGMLWTVIIPAVQAVVFYSVFSVVLRVKTDNYLLLLMGSLVPWVFLNSSLLSGMESLVGNQSLLNKVQIPIQSLVYADSITHFFNLLCTLPVLAVIFAFSNVPITVALAQYPVLLLCLSLMAYSLSLILSMLYVYFRDLRFMVTLVLQLAFYVTPITYPTSMIPDSYRFALDLNPVGRIFDGFQAALVRQEILSDRSWMVIIGWTGFCVLSSVCLWWRNKNTLVEIL